MEANVPPDLSWAPPPPLTSRQTSDHSHNRNLPGLRSRSHRQADRLWGGGGGLDHEAVLLAIVGHQDDVAVGGPDEAGQPQVVLGARGRRLHRRNLVGLDAAELRSRVQHPDAAQQAGVHLRGGRGQRSGQTSQKATKSKLNVIS